VNFKGVPVHCLDVEGEDAAARAPTEDQESWIGTVIELFGTDTPENRKKYFKLRNHAVREHFPRLAYAVSDVLVLVNTDSLARADYKKKIKNFTQRASEGLLGCELPFLLIVQNQTFTDIDNIRNTEEITKQFLATHDPKGNLSKYFSAIKCVGIPSSSFGEHFWAGVDNFGRALVDLLNHSASLRSMNGNALPSNSWFYLVQEIMKEFNSNSSLRIGTMLTKTVTESLPNEVLRSVLKFFFAVSVSHNPTHWNYAKNAAVRMLAVLIQEQILQAKRFGLKESDLRFTELNQELRGKLVELCERIDKDKICCATQNGWNCVLTQCTHRNDHFNPRDTKMGGKFTRSIKKTFKWRNNHWPGKFEDNGVYDSLATLTALLDSTLNEIQKAIAENPNQGDNVILAFKKDIWAQAIGGEISALISSGESYWKLPVFCCFCFGNASVTSGLCGHRIVCKSCNDAITNFPKQLNIISTLTNRVINLSTCPICVQPF